jgi:hypothetical protein
MALSSSVRAPHLLLIAHSMYDIVREGTIGICKGYVRFFLHSSNLSHRFCPDVLCHLNQIQLFKKDTLSAS